MKNIPILSTALVMLTAATCSTHSQTVVNNTGCVEIACDAYVRIYLDRKKMGETRAGQSFVIQNIKHGKHTIRAEKPGCKPIFLSFEVSNTRRVHRLEIKAFHLIGGTIIVQSLHEDCNVKILGHDLGGPTTKLYLKMDDVPVGKHRVVFSQGARRFTREIGVGENDEIHLVVDFSTRPGFVRVSRSPGNELTDVQPGFTYEGIRRFSCGGRTNRLRIYRHDKTGLEFVLIRSGTFDMGWPQNEPGGHETEGPQRKVTVASFLICRTECTQDAWDRIGGTDRRKWKGKALPIENVSWSDCASWCKKAGLRLPSEAEWEYACRGETTTAFCFGNSDRDLNEYGWHRGNSENRTHPVGTKKPNSFGVFDMHGNVFEWCQDKWHFRYLDAPCDGSPCDSGESSNRVLRGGRFYYTAQDCRSTIRHGWTGPGDDGSLGFRPACSLPSR